LISFFDEANISSLKYSLRVTPAVIAPVVYEAPKYSPSDLTAWPGFAFCSALK